MPPAACASGRSRAHRTGRRTSDRSRWGSIAASETHARHRVEPRLLHAWNGASPPPRHRRRGGLRGGRKAASRSTARTCRRRLAPPVRPRRACAPPAKNAIVAAHDRASFAPPAWHRLPRIRAGRLRAAAWPPVHWANQSVGGDLPAAFCGSSLARRKADAELPEELRYQAEPEVVDRVRAAVIESCCHSVFTTWPPSTASTAPVV